MWNGECFVFDERCVAPLGMGLPKATCELAAPARHPLTPQDKLSQLRKVFPAPDAMPSAACAGRPCAHAEGARSR